jgi:hypothetical protein
MWLLRFLAWDDFDRLQERLAHEARIMALVMIDEDRAARPANEPGEGKA